MDGLPLADLYQLRKCVPEDFKYLLTFIRCGSLAIDVVDHGPGMDQDEISRLFKKGVQFNPNQLQAGQGSGLGLWISKGIVELHMGRLIAYSEGLGRGSTFTIEIPLVEKPPFLKSISEGIIDIAEDAIEMAPALSMQNTSLDQGMSDTDRKLQRSRLVAEMKLSRILLVDDTPTNRKIVKRVLRSDGYTDVDEAKDGLECIELVTSQPANEPRYDLILMDYEMPRMNGPDATSRLRKLGYTIPIIGVTGNLLNEDVTHFLACGVDSVLPKPVVMQDLYRAYSAAINSRL